MSSLTARQRSNWPPWLRGSLLVAVSGVLALTLARWPNATRTALVGVVFALILCRVIQTRSRPSFSLKTMLIVTGLVCCAIVLRLQGGPWKEVHHFPGQEVNIAISADGQLVAASNGTAIEIRDTHTGRFVQTIKMPASEAKKKGNQKWFFKMEFTKDGKSLMTVDWQTYPCLLDVATGKELRRWPSSQGMGALAASGTRFVADSVVASNRAKHCNVYAIDRDQPILTIETEHRYCRSISPTGSHVLAGKDKNTAELWSVDEKRLVGTIPIPSIHPGLFFVEFSRDGKLLAIPTSTGVAVWDVTKCRKAAEWNPTKFDHIKSLKWSPDGSRLVASYIELIGPSGPAAVAAAMAGKSERNAVEHSFLTGQNCQEIALISGTSATFSPSGDRIATVFGNVQIFDGRTGELLTRVNSARPRESVLGLPSILFSPDGDWLFHNGSPTVFRRTRPEYWYSIFEIPAYWGMVLSLTVLIVQLCHLPPRRGAR